MALTVASQNELHVAGRIEAAGAVDADGHILEPPDLWETYIDPQYRDRALRITVDENGLEELEIDGRRSTMSRRGFPATLGAMGAPDLADIQKDVGEGATACATFRSYLELHGTARTGGRCPGSNGS